MRAFLFGFLLFLAVSVQAQGRMEVSRDGRSARIVNVGNYFIVCEIVVDGRSAYWELYPGQATAWYRHFDGWRCS